MHKYDIHPISSPHQRNYKKQLNKQLASPNSIRNEKDYSIAPNELWACDFTYL